jgi:hypothetical protein
MLRILFNLVSLLFLLMGVVEVASGRYGQGVVLALVGLLMLRIVHGSRRPTHGRKNRTPKSSPRKATAIRRPRIAIDTMGIPASEIYRSRSARAILKKAAFSAAEHIRDIPAEYIGSAESVEHVRSMPVAEYIDKVAATMIAVLKDEPLPHDRTLAEQIMSIFNSKITEDHARFIARDQIHKVKSKVEEAQHREVGGRKYIWRTMRDQRVVGAPGGMYPAPTDSEGRRIHGNHYEREGKVFAWDDPPPDGHPGQACGCRCYAEPVIDVESILFPD